MKIKKIKIIPQEKWGNAYWKSQANTVTHAWQLINNHHFFA